MAIYRVYGSILESEFPLPELCSAKGKPRFQVNVSTPFSSSKKFHWYHDWSLADGRVWLSLARSNGQYLFHFPELADFVLTLRSNRITCHPRANTQAETLRHLLLDQVLPLFLTLHGKTLLHAGAVAVANRALVFLGGTGQGKSTLTASFANAGFPFLCDDCLYIKSYQGRLAGVPAYSGLRLWSDSLQALFPSSYHDTLVAEYSSKRRLVTSKFPTPACQIPVPIGAFYVIDSTVRSADLPPLIIALKPAAAFLALFKNTFRMEFSDPIRCRKEFLRLSKLVKLAPFYRLQYSRQYEWLPHIHQLVLESVSQKEPNLLASALPKRCPS